MAMTVDRVLGTADREAEAVLQGASSAKRDAAVDKAAAEMLKSQAKAAERQAVLEEKKALELADASKIAKLTKIKKYLQMFEEALKEVPRPTPHSTEADLDAILVIIRETLGSRQSLSRLRKAFAMCLTVLQGSWGDGKQLPPYVPEALRLDLSHVSEFYKAGLFDEEVEPVLQQLDIEYPWLGRASLLRQTSDMALSIAFKTNYMNKQGIPVNAAAQLRQMPPVEVGDE
jgi:hypothetical protein